MTIPVFEMLFSEDVRRTCPPGRTPCGETCISYFAANYSYECEGRCQSLSQPCRQTSCSLGWSLCGDRCLADEERADWQECKGECIGATRACRGICPPGTRKCGIRCLEDRLNMQQLFYACGDNCQLFSEPCRGSCPVGTRPCQSGSETEDDDGEEEKREEEGTASSELVMVLTLSGASNLSLARSVQSKKGARALKSPKEPGLKCCSPELSRLLPDL